MFVGWLVGLFVCLFVCLFVFFGFFLLVCFVCLFVCLLFIISSLFCFGGGGGLEMTSCWIVAACRRWFRVFFWPFVVAFPNPSTGGFRGGQFSQPGLRPQPAGRRREADLGLQQLPGEARGPKNPEPRAEWEGAREREPRQQEPQEYGWAEGQNQWDPILG